MLVPLSRGAAPPSTNPKPLRLLLLLLRLEPLLLPPAQILSMRSLKGLHLRILSPLALQDPGVPLPRRLMVRVFVSTSPRVDSNYILFFSDQSQSQMSTTGLLLRLQHQVMPHRPLERQRLPRRSSV